MVAVQRESQQDSCQGAPCAAGSPCGPLSGQHGARPGWRFEDVLQNPNTLPNVENVEGKNAFGFPAHFLGLADAKESFLLLTELG